MGASISKIEEDKALQLCHERKKFFRQALDGRCSLAAAHVAYIQCLRNTGTALRKFVEPEAPVLSSPYTSTSATPVPFGLTNKSRSPFSLSSTSLSHPMRANENHSPTLSSRSSTQFEVNHMKFRWFSSKKVEEKPPIAVTESVTMSSNPTDKTPRATEKPETSPFEASSAPPGTPPWDYFELFHPIDNPLSFHEGGEMNQELDIRDGMRQLREEEGIPELESFEGSEESEKSDDEFDDPPPDTLVRTFKNFNRLNDHDASIASPKTPSAKEVALETELLNGKKSKSPDLSPLRTPTSAISASLDTKETPVKVEQDENKIFPKDFISSVKEIEYLFIKACESGKEVPRMLEANKLHFRPIVPGKENGSVAVTFFKACFSCGEDPVQAKEEPAQNDVKYLTWHRTTSSRSSSSRNLLGVNRNDEMEDHTSCLFDNTCMISGSHASTLDRLYAWERKLYDEVKACGIVRRDYDAKCKVLRQLESKGESQDKIYKTRAEVKDLHSRIWVAIQRIDSISNRIEELRDKELQPQLEELIEGLSRMWEVMFECHKLQFSIISLAYDNGTNKISAESESRHLITIYLENEFNFLSSSFMKWIGAQKSYLDAINHWLFKCFLVRKPSGRKKKQQDPSLELRRFGPPIYAMCGVWLDEFEKLPAKEVVESIKGLAAETSQFIPFQGKNQAKGTSQTSWKVENGSGLVPNITRDEALEDNNPAFVRFRSSLEGFLGQLSNFAESSVRMYSKLEKTIQDSRSNFEQFKSQKPVV